MAKGKAGRPKAAIDYEVVRRLRERGCSQREVAAVVGVDEATIRRRIDSDAEFAAIMEDSPHIGKKLLRFAIWDNALHGDVKAQIFLCKNLLGMSEKVDQRSDVNVAVTTWDEIVEASKDE